MFYITYTSTLKYQIRIALLFLEIKQTFYNVIFALNTYRRWSYCSIRVFIRCQNGSICISLIRRNSWHWLVAFQYKRCTDSRPESLEMCTDRSDHLVCGWILPTSVQHVVFQKCQEAFKMLMNEWNLWLRGWDAFAQWRGLKVLYANQTDEC